MRTWSTFSHDYRLCERCDRPLGWAVLAPGAGCSALRSELTKTGRGWTSSAPTTESVEWLVEKGFLVVVARPILYLTDRGPPVGGAPRAQQAQAEPRRQLDWLDVIVIDDGAPPQPLKGARIHVGLPDGTVHDGLLGGQGGLRVDGVEPGWCWIELGDLGNTARKP